MKFFLSMFYYALKVKIAVLIVTLWKPPWKRSSARDSFSIRKLHLFIGMLEKNLQRVQIYELHGNDGHSAVQTVRSKPCVFYSIGIKLIEIWNDVTKHFIAVRGVSNTHTHAHTIGSIFWFTKRHTRPHDETQSSMKLRFVNITSIEQGAPNKLIRVCCTHYRIE